MPIHRERYRRREDGIDFRGRAWIVIAAFLRFVRTQRFTAFVIYRIALGIAVLAWAATGGGG